MQAGFVGWAGHRLGHWTAGVVLAFSSLAAGAYSVSLSPESQSVAKGTEVLVTVTAGDVVANGGLGAYDFSLGYDSNILSFLGVDVGAQLGATTGDALAFEDLGVGLLLILQTFDETDTALLLQQQSDLFAQRADATLFTVRFSTIGLGTSALSFESATMNDVTAGFPVDLANIAHNAASITVFENLSVPEPGSLSLLAAAVLAAGLARRRKPAI